MYTVAIVVCGYGMMRCPSIEAYVKYVAEIALKEAQKNQALLIFSGGDTTDEKNGPWRNEAELMYTIGVELFGKSLWNLVYLETESFNTLTNIKYSRALAEAVIKRESDEMIIVCSSSHFLKVFFATVSLLGWRRALFKTKIKSFPLIKRWSGEYVKILLKTIPEVIGYFVPFIGTKIQALQYKKRTGRHKETKEVKKT